MQPLFAVLCAAAAVSYPLIEARWYRLNRLRVPVERDVGRLSILHVSDIHHTDARARVVRFLRSVPQHVGRPDIVIATGDLIEDDSGIEPITAALNMLEARYGRFYVLGSHDYYQSRFQSYTKYFSSKRDAPPVKRADTALLERKLQDGGWVSLMNRTELIDTAAGRIRVAGVDDPYLDRDTDTHIQRSSGERFAIGLTHSPDSISRWMLTGFDLVLAGHTHAGQVRLPGVGALVTNSDLPSALAGGLHRIGAGWLHVSPGLGTGRFAPIRFNCRPEVTLLEVQGPG
jgi:predicted MPP superfamily phosphohydrolase